MSNKKVNIELTNDEAVVLFEFLSRFNQSELTGSFEDQAEQRVLWNIESDLEKKLSEIFKSNYQEILKIAREKIRDKE